MYIEQWLGLFARGMRLWKRDGFVAFIRRIRLKLSWQAKVFGSRLPSSLHRYLAADLLHVNGISPRPPLEPHRATVDIIVCIHNALPEVRSCLESVVRNTTPPFSLILVDDGSLSETRDEIAEFAKTHRAVLLRNEEARGYTRAANQGLKRSSADYAVLLNSDTVVTDHWLDRLIACAESNPRTGLVGPLSNTASWQSIPEIQSQGDWAANPLPGGTSIDDMGRLIATYSDRLYPPMTLLNGFCLLIRRDVIRKIGYFDEVNFGQGYGEEDDYTLRARKAGWMLALADDVYVYHAQSRSYSKETRQTLTRRAGTLLLKKHKQTIISESLRFCQSNRVLEGIRARSRVLFARRECIETGRARFAGRRALFVLPIIEPAGGANIVLREAKAMRQMGVDATIFNFESNRCGFQQGYPELDLPVVYGKIEDIPYYASRNDAVIATANYSVEMLGSVVRREGYPVRGYYVQGFEPLVYTPGTPDFQKAWESYTLFPDLVRFAKTEWTRQEVEKHTGARCALVGVSLDIDLFRPRPRSTPEWPKRPLRIGAMIRPSTPYREPKLTMELLRRASRQFPGTEVMIFGTWLEAPGFYPLPHDFPWKLAGVLSPNQVASFLNQVDIFVDFSSHQAMGLTALEAMACGAATIVPEYGGAGSFARHGENSLIVDTTSSEKCWNALQRLIQDHDLRAQLQSHALVDVCEFFPERSALCILNTLLGSVDQEIT